MGTRPQCMRAGTLKALSDQLLMSFLRYVILTYVMSKHLYVLVEAPVRVYYEKYLTRDVSRG